ncbi:DUF4340 domain-containing protein [Ponticaulis sp.]|uniref:DUF4340 domain-containing protein n=1 Tax=Ponticaulis sp. TaxID=2020902 RepID=UPI000B67198F|nr:DUF4340 domain-containing protein [Ponticaulis sp.]MAI89782.1 hypothetical protein [Ponticaulis sp.]OUX99460.1 MAG: hypothetical protein CBB65_05025 [Hyphomonadaceae bacterium TMED5]|tara:strand:- start:13097 stop:14014 length:918 start_codon:yes stop_codon:yes gene_type:complete
MRHPLNTPRNTFLMLTAALALIALVSFVIQNVSNHSTELAGRPAFTEAQISSTREIEVVTSDATYTLKRIETGWVMPEKADFPVAENAITSLLTALTDLNIEMSTTQLPARHALLGLTDPADSGFGARLTLDQDSSRIFGQRAGQQFMREPEEDQTYQVSPVLPPLYNPMRWIDLSDDTLPRLTGEIVQIQLETNVTDAIYRLSSGVWHKDGSDEEPVNAAPLNNAIYASYYLEFTDVRRRTDAQAFARIGFGYADGETQIISLVREGNETWARFEFSDGIADVELYESREFKLEALSVADLLLE